MHTDPASIIGQFPLLQEQVSLDECSDYSIYMYHDTIFFCLKLVIHYF